MKEEAKLLIVCTRTLFNVSDKWFWYVFVCVCVCVCVCVLGGRSLLEQVRGAGWAINQRQSTHCCHLLIGKPTLVAENVN